MTVDLDVLRAFMENRVIGNMKCSLIITKQVHGLLVKNTKERQARDFNKPNYTCGCCHRTVLSLGR